MTTASPSLAPAERGSGSPPRVIERQRGLPSSRAAVGALLVTAAAVGTFLAYTQATAHPTEPVVVAARQLRAGEVLAADDLQVAQADLPANAARSVFHDISALEGFVVLGPIAEGELLQRGAVTRQRASPAHEVALTLPRPQVAIGRLQRGDLVDVFVTDAEGTRSVVRAVSVVDLDEPDGSLTAAREVTLVVAVTQEAGVAAVVHALRTGDVTIVRSTGASATSEPIVHAAPGDEAEGGPAEADGR